MWLTSDFRCAFDRFLRKRKTKKDVTKYRLVVCHILLFPWQENIKVLRCLLLRRYHDVLLMLSVASYSK